MLIDANTIAVTDACEPTPVVYDKWGRMKFHPDFHSKHGKPWTNVDEKYLIENYEVMGPEHVSLALERTISTVMTRVYELRRDGKMAKAGKKTYATRSGARTPLVAA